MNDNLEIIRKAVIAANPEIRNWSDCFVHNPLLQGGADGDSCQCKIRPIRLADVMLAIQHQRVLENGGKIPTSASKIFETTGKINELIWLRWNLRKDSLEEQSEECLQFLGTLLE